MKEDTSFLHDYFDFLREAGDWRRIEAIFKEQSDLAQRPEFQDVYESLQDWLAENEGF